MPQLEREEADERCDDCGRDAVHAQRLDERELDVQEDRGRDEPYDAERRDRLVEGMVRLYEERDDAREEREIEHEAVRGERDAPQLRVRALRDDVAAIERRAYIAEERRSLEGRLREVPGVRDAEDSEHEKRDEESLPAIHEAIVARPFG